jgi:hypothetical protein
VELTINNIIVAYFFDQFGLSLEIAGIVGAVFGLMNLFCRSMGGIASDVMGKYFGMRGRLWTYFTMQVRKEGYLCSALCDFCMLPLLPSVLLKPLMGGVVFPIRILYQAMSAALWCYKRVTALLPLPCLF